MKPFKPRTIEQQRKNYVKACKQRLRREVHELKEIYREEHERYAQLYFDKCSIERRVDEVQDKVADDADKEFGGWDTWRHDEKLLRIVVKRMDDAVVRHRARIAEIDGKMDRCLADYNTEVKTLLRKYDALIKTA